MDRETFKKEMDGLIQEARALNDLMKERIADARFKGRLDDDIMNDLIQIKNEYVLRVRQFKKIKEQYKNLS